MAEDIAAALDLLGGPKDDPVVDFLVDPGAACRALDALPEHGGLVMRAAPALAAPAAGYGPVPADPVWVRIMRGAREVGTALYRGGDGMVRKAARVEIEERDEPCCESPGCDRRRAHASVWLVLEGMNGAADERLLVAEQRTIEGAPEVARGIAARLAGAITAPLVRDGEPFAAEIGAAPAPLGDALPPADLARFALRSEGGRVIVRDWDSLGPRATAPRNTWIGAVLMVMAAACWFALWRALAGGSQNAAIGVGIAAALLTLTGYAFLGVARFSAKYRAGSAPLAAVGADRFIVLPWVGRDGAVDARPEGRLGAAMPLVEVRASSAVPSAGGVAVRIDTDHGAMDVMICATAAAAEVWCKALDRAVDEARHPRAGATARQRARARQQAATA
ncbi:MAG: hypothetical protein QM820_33935 [Minicystis sp.]